MRVDWFDTWELEGRQNRSGIGLRYVNTLGGYCMGRIEMSIWVAAFFLAIALLIAAYAPQTPRDCMIEGLLVDVGEDELESVFA